MSIEMGESVPSDRSWKYEIHTRGKETAKSITVLESDSSLRKLRTSSDHLLGGEKKKQSNALPPSQEEEIQRQIWLEPGHGERGRLELGHELGGGRCPDRLCAVPDH